MVWAHKKGSLLFFIYFPFFFKLDVLEDGKSSNFMAVDAHMP
jgi:hypothetical protein